MCFAWCAIGVCDGEKVAEGGRKAGGSVGALGRHSFFVEKRTSDERIVLCACGDCKSGVFECAVGLEYRITRKGANYFNFNFAKKIINKSASLVVLELSLQINRIENLRKTRSALSPML